MSVLKKTYRRGRAALGLTNGFGPKFSVRDDDVFIVSYPKSGNTWTRFLIGNAVSGADGSVDFANIDHVIPDLHRIAVKDLDAMQTRRFIKSHASFDPNYPRVIYITRHPFDVVVSYYYYQIKMGQIDKSVELTDFAQDFLDHRHPMGTWAQNVGSWFGAMGENPNFLWLRYEDMLADTETALSSICDFCELDLSADQISRAVSLSTSDRMRELEKAQANKWGPTRNSDKSISFVRKARADYGKAELGEEMTLAIYNKWSAFMDRAGYLPDGSCNAKD